MLLNTDIKVLCCHTCLLDRWSCFSEHYRHTHVLMYTWGSIHTSHFLWRLCIFNVWRRNMFISVFFHSCHRVRLISRYRQLERNCIRINHREGWKHDSAATGLINFLPQWNRYRSSFFFHLFVFMWQSHSKVEHLLHELRYILRNISNCWWDWDIIMFHDANVEKKMGL